MKDFLSGLYLITPHLANDDLLFSICEKVLKNGVSLLQYRDKHNTIEKKLYRAKVLREITKKYDTKLIINDSLLLCLKCNADGLHYGKDDGSLIFARKILGNDKILGASCYNSLDTAIRAKTLGVDYIAFGAVAKSPTKPNNKLVPLETISKAKHSLKIPVCAIGGITTQNAYAIKQNGVDMLAVISDIFDDFDEQQCSKKINFYNSLFEKNPRDFQKIF